MFHPSDYGRGRQVPAHRAEGPFRELLEVVASAFYTQMLHGAGIFTYIYPKNGPVL